MTENTERAEFLARRKKGIGGSDAAAIFGCNPWQSKFYLYQDKVSAIVDDEETPAQYWGRKLEKVVRSAYAETLGRKVVDGVDHTAHKEHAFMLANTDGTILEVPDFDGPGVYEGKTTSVFNESQWAEDVPLYYQVQVQHYLAVLGWAWGSVACFIAGSRDPLIYRDVERNDRFIEALVEAEHKFWTEHVIPRNPPPVDGSTATEKALKLLYPKDSGRVISLPSDIESVWTKHQNTKAEIKNLKDRERFLSNKIREAMEDASYGVFPNGSGISLKYQRGGIPPNAILDAVSDKYGEEARAEIVRAAQDMRPEFRTLRKASDKTLKAVQENDQDQGN